jgi:TolA-binding protein
MKRIALLFIPLLVLAGCSKKQEAEAWSSTDASSYQEEQFTTDLAPHLQAVQSDLQNKNFQELTDRLDVLAQIPKSPEQDVEYRRTLHEVRENLRQQADNDPAAQQAYHYFGRRMLGR